MSGREWRGRECVIVAVLARLELLTFARQRVDAIRA